MAAPTTIPSKEAKDAKAAAAKQHRRSRSGCFTCRLRRKKCDEAKPSCRACKNLCLKCEYKRPQWWGNGDQRRQQKDHIKEIIKQTQLSKKTAQMGHAHMHHSAHTPPSLCHSLPTSDGYPDSLARSHSHSRAPSIDQSPLTSDLGYAGVSPEGYFAIPPSLHSIHPHPQYPMFSPYEIDIKTERQIFVNDVPTRKDSTISTFSTYQPPPPPAGGASQFPADTWLEHNRFETSNEVFTEEPVDFDVFDFQHPLATPSHESIIEVEERDRPMLNHFLEKVMKLIFPVLDANQHGSARSSAILPALEKNKGYLHCCLDIAAVHKKSTERIPDGPIDEDMSRHRFETITELCNALSNTESYNSALEATLAVIFFQSVVGRPEDAAAKENSIPWHQHLTYAMDLVARLELPQQMTVPAYGVVSHPPFNMTLTAWIDILGATMLGRSPLHADTYRELNISKKGAGLAELMGCDDHVMFLISEIACLEARRLEGIDDVVLCKYIEILGTEISLSESDAAAMVESAISASGAIRPKQLTVNMTAVFRLAARIYLCGMVPGFALSSPSIVNLVAQFTDAMDFVPGGPEGFDRSLVWPLLVAGAVSSPGSKFRSMYAARCARLGEAAQFGSFGRVRHLLTELWAHNDMLLAATASGATPGEGHALGTYQSLHWRELMQSKGWDSLLI